MTTKNFCCASTRAPRARAASCSTAAAASSRWRSASSARSIRSRAGSNTTRRRSGPRSWRRRQEALSEAGVAAHDIAAIGITNQRETTLVWNRRTGEPIHTAIVWQDRRTEPICAGCASAASRRLVRDKTGLVIDAYFSGTKLKWILDHVDGARALAGAASSRSAPSTAGCCGSSPAARCTRPTSATRRARCC
jgi:hypothetical protein